MMGNRFVSDFLLVFPVACTAMMAGTARCISTAGAVAHTIAVSGAGTIAYTVVPVASTDTGTVTNAGTIAGAVAHAVPVAISGAGASSVTNAGTIAGAVAHAVAVAISGTDAGAVANAGTIAGTVAHAVPVAISGTDAGAIANAGAIAGAITYAIAVPNTGNRGRRGRNGFFLHAQFRFSKFIQAVVFSGNFSVRFAGFGPFLLHVFQAHTGYTGSGLGRRLISGFGKSRNRKCTTDQQDSCG